MILRILRKMTNFALDQAQRDVRTWKAAHNTLTQNTFSVLCAGAVCIRGPRKEVKMLSRPSARENHAYRGGFNFTSAASAARSIGFSGIHMDS